MTLQAAPPAKLTRTAVLRKRLPTILGALASITILIVALWFLQRQLSGLSFSSIIAHTRAIPLLALLAAIGCATCSYLVLTGFDAAGLKYLRLHVPYRNVALTSFMAFAVGHNVGFSALSGGSIRYRMYTLAGLTAADIAKLIVFIAGTYSLGASGLLGVALLRMPAAQTAVFKVQPEWVALAGGLLLLVPFIYFAITLWRRAPVSIGDWRIEVPRPRLAIAQISLSIGDLLFAAATLYVLLEPFLDIGFLPFLGVYLLAVGAGVLSGVPGGLGIFEAVLVAAFPQVEVGALLGIIILYRVIYYLAPLTLALLLLVGHEAHQHGQVLRESTAKAVDWFSGIAPQLIGSVVFMAGAVVLISDASPATEARLVRISQAIPLPVLELSHLAASVIGIALLILARGLFRRLAGAYRVALVALTTAMFLSLFKGLYYAEATMLGAIALALWISRDQFNRDDTLIAQRFPAPWLGAIVLVVSTAIFTGLTNFSHGEYTSELWWQFAHEAHASRMLRAILLAVVSGLAFALWKALHTGKMEFPPPATEAEIDAAREIVSRAENPLANAALLGDKRFLWSADRQAFIMYQISGASWIACGDPVGPARYHQELAWAFRELVERYAGSTVFYEVSDESLELYVDLGLTLSKIGEQGTIALQDFSLHDSVHDSVRQAHRGAVAMGAEFTFVPQSHVAAMANDLQSIFAQAAAQASLAEHGFSLGVFSADYIANFDCAVIELNNSLKAFAILWPADSERALAVDLLCCAPDAPAELKEYLFVEVMLWGKAHGYESFQLGMTPVSEVSERSLAPVWQEIGHRIFVHGEHFASFAELRGFKNQFYPHWQPRYLACPGGWRKLPRALSDAANLVGV